MSFIPVMEKLNFRYMYIYIYIYIYTAEKLKYQNEAEIPILRGHAIFTSYFNLSFLMLWDIKGIALTA